jgi:hypothetical protein
MGCECLATGGVDVTTVTGGHGTLLHRCNIAPLAARLAALLQTRARV